MEQDQQSRLIRRLLKEQDAVLEQLDQLNERIEQALRELAPARPANTSDQLAAA